MATRKSPAGAPHPSSRSPGLRIHALTGGFRRCGRAWGAEPVDVPLAEFSEAQGAALRGEPQLVVEDVEIDATALTEPSPPAPLPAGEG